MAKRSLLHPRFLERVTAFYPDKAHIQRATESQSASGSPTQTWAYIPALRNIDASLAPLFSRSPTEGEFRMMQLTYAQATHHVALRGYYPEISSEMRVLIGGTAFDINAVEFDSHHTTTRLRVREVTV